MACAIRAQLLEGSAKDENHATFNAIKDLSRKGDDPMQRVAGTWMAEIAFRLALFILRRCY